MIKLQKRNALRATPGEHFLLFLYSNCRHLPDHDGDVMARERSNVMFANYPDVVCVDQLCAMLGGIGKKTAYNLLKTGEIRCLKIGKSFKIPKVCVIEYLVGRNEEISP